jgi:hypothetical protein
VGTLAFDQDDKDGLEEVVKILVNSCDWNF